MAREAKQSENYNYLVETQKLFTSDGVDSGWFSNRRTDTGETLGVCSEYYGLVQNQDLVSIAEDAFAKRGLTDYKRRLVVSGAGERMFATYDFTSHVVKVPKVGDEVGLRLTLQNSFDRTLKASFEMGALRLACLNGMKTMEKEIGFSRKHSLKMDITGDYVVDALDKALARFERSIEVFGTLAEAKVTQEQGLRILNNLTEGNALSEKLREGVAAIWESPRYTQDHARNLYNLYNAVTQHLTHQVASDRFELANRTSGLVLDRLTRATRNTATWEKLIAVPAATRVSLN